MAREPQRVELQPLTSLYPWGTMRLVAADDAAIAAWFGCITLGRR